jgi:prepilin-type N-terminal cleavage/methylation domain-containing protein
VSVAKVRGESGYSVVEMLTVMAIMSIVFAGITTVFVAGSNAQVEQDQRFQAQLETRLAMDKVRRDIHCASGVSAHTSSAVTLTITGCGTDVSWCTFAVAGHANRFTLHRTVGSTCSSSSTRVADYLVSGDVFGAFSHVEGCGCLASLAVDFRVSLKSSATDGAYQLRDTIYLRNSTRI